MRHWFAGRDVEAFSISVWVRREPGGNSKANIVQNGECEVPSFHITTENGTLYGGIRTDYNMTLNGSAVINHQLISAMRYIGYNFEKCSIFVCKRLELGVFFYVTTLFLPWVGIT